MLSAEQFPSTSDFSRQTSRGDRGLHALAVFDQAIQSLFELRDLTQVPRPPRSMLLDFIHLNQRFTRNERFVSQAGLLVAAGQSVLRLGQEWKHALKQPKLTPREVRSTSDQWARYYQVGSLAVASLAVAWLLVRKR